MSKLEIIIAELKRQYEASRGTGLGWFDAERPNEAVIDGRVDLVALAVALAGRKEWQPIDTAPKDGRRVLVWNPNWSAAIAAQWYGEDWRIVYTLQPFNHQPTHWRALPAPPSSMEQ
jgi:hypothetical protein